MRLENNFDLTLIKFLVCLVFFITPLESVGASEEIASFSLAKLVVLLLVVVWGFTSRRLEHNFIISFFSTLGLYWLLSCSWALNPSISFIRVFNFFIPSLITIMIIGYEIRNKNDLRNVLVSYLLGSIVLAINCHLSRADVLANAMYEDMERVTTLGQDQNELSFLIVMGIVIALHGIQEYNTKFLRILLIFCSLFLTYVILLTGSRTGVIMVLFVFVFFALNNKNYIKLILPILILCFPIIINQIPNSSIERILNTTDSISSGDLSNRGDIWERAINAFVNEDYIFGVGYLNFPEMMRLHYGKACASHNTYLSYLISGGVVGAILFIVLLFNMYKFCFSIVKLTRNSYWYSYLLPLMIAMITLETQFRRWIFLIAIVLYKASKIVKQNINE